MNIFTRTISILLISMFLLSCANSRPHTKEEKYWFATMVAGQVADTASSQYAIHRGNEEANPIYGKDGNVAVMIAVKAAAIGIVYGLGQVDPDNRKTYYIIGSIIGVGATGWNLYQLEKGK